MQTCLECLFPALRDGGYEVTSPESSDYNCIAWAAGVTDRCWWPHPQYYWPDKSYESSVDGFIRVFRDLGYEVCGNADLEPGFEKVAIYLKGSAPEHMARQLDSGEWSSKCGELEDLTHRLEVLECAHYGRASVFMKRPRPDRGASPAGSSRPGGT